MPNLRGRFYGTRRRTWAGTLSALAVAGLALAYAAIIPSGGILTVGSKPTPIALAVISASGLPPEIQAQEAATAPNLFDRDTTTEHVVFADSQVEAVFESLHELRAIKVFGAAPYVLTVQADAAGGYQIIPGLENVNLTLLPTGWSTFEASAPVTTGKVLFVLTPATGGTATGLRELEVWTTATPVSVKDGEALLEKLLGPVPPPQGRVYPAVNPTATPNEGVIGISDAGAELADNTFSFTLDRDPAHFVRAYLTYELFGQASFVSPLRRLNSSNAGGALILPSTTGNTQVERINPAWLKLGANTIEFDVLSASFKDAGYSVRNVRFVLELDTGANAVDSITVNQPDAVGTNPIDALYDGDLATGWKPYPPDQPITAVSPVVEFELRRPTQVEAVALNLSAPLGGEIQLSLKQAGQWVDQPPVNAASLGSGWNTIPVDTATALNQRIVEAVRLTFLGGSTGAAELREFLFVGSGVGGRTAPPKIFITYPDAGQFHGRSAFVQGFVEPWDNGSGTAKITLGGQTVLHVDGTISNTRGKDSVGFTAQADNDPWSLEVKAVYPNGETVSRIIELTEQMSQAEPAAGVLAGSFSDTVKTKGKKTIAHDESKLVFATGTVAADTPVTVTPLDEDSLPALDTGMTNVTKGPRRGYRFLPHGAKFLKNVDLALPYDKALIPPGHTEDDVKTFYFDETTGRWIELPRVSVDKTTKVVNSLTDHFTDMINATVTVPDHPQTTSFNPTQIKDIKAADPGAQINLIDPPQANPMGDARLSYPIEVPPGRNGLQAQIAVQYNSSGGNGWLGMGWDIAMQGVTIDTRWGVPRYDNGGPNDIQPGTPLETETYLLNGEQLTPVVHRGDLQPRTAEKIFHTRVEGQFRKIIRHGTNPANYWWEVFDKNGTRFLYGGGPDTNGGLGGPTKNSTLTDLTVNVTENKGNIFFWSLREIRDTNDNFVKYSCEFLRDNGVPGGTQPGGSLYLTEISYTGHGITEGPYKVTFTRDRNLGEPRRQDVIIDARGGFKKVTGDLLRKVEVSLNNALIRSYELTYNDNPYGDNRLGTAFNKTLLTSITQFGEDGSEFNAHAFTYNDEVRDQSGNYLGFAFPQDWTVPSDSIKGNLIGGNDRASAIGGSETSGAGGHLYVGFNLAKPDKKFSFGAKVGHQRSRSQGRLQLMDINGDGLPDKVFKNGGVVFRPNLFNVNGQTAFSSGTPQPATNLSDLSREDTESTTFGGEAYVGANVFTNRIDTFSTASKYISDVNGDGLPDLVNNGGVLFNAADGSGAVAYSANSNDTLYPIGAGAVAADQLLDDFTEIFETRIDQFPLMDAVRRWTAPFSGQIRITAPVNLIQDPSRERADYQSADGVRVAIQHEASELWFTEIGPEDHAVKTPVGVESLTVVKGQRIYFRVQSKFDGAFDQVSWNPVIEYLSVTPTTDVNNLDVFRYEAATDFVLTGRPNEVSAPLNGTVKVGGVLTKKAVTTDNIEAQILKNGAIFASRTLAWDQVSTIDFSDLNIPVAVAGDISDKLILRIKVDSPIDATQIDWTPEIFYTESPDAPVLDQNGQFQIKIAAPFDMDLYPRNNLTAPQPAWTVTQTGTATIVPAITSPSGEFILTVKKQGAFVAKHTFTVAPDPADPATLVLTPSSVSLPVTLNDRLYFDLNVRDAGFFDQIQSAGVGVTFGDPDIDPVTPVPSALHGNEFAGAFPVRYRGWAATAYNGNRDRATLPIDQSVLVVDRNYTLETARVYPLAPIPNENRWRAQDENNWVAAGSMSSSRLGIDFIQVPQAGTFAGARAVDRIGRSRETSVGGGASFLSGSFTRDSFSNSELDFIDLNGDRFPDIVGNGRVQYTTLTGGLESTNRGVPGFSKIRRSATFGRTLGIGGNPASNKGDSSGGNAPKGGGAGVKAKVKVFIVKSDMPSIGLSANTSRGTSKPEFDLMDVNGDGLPDRVIQSGTNLSVQLNLGYKFGVAEPWGAATISDGVSQGLSGGLGYNDSIYGWAGGLNLGRNDSRTKATLLDINGDGLLDRVTPAGNALSVGFNRGNGFAPNVAWSGALKDEITTNTSDTQGAGAYFTIGIGPLCFPTPLCYIIINPGVNGSVGMGRQEVSIQDIDGDGYPDHLFSERDSELRVAANRTGRTNFLKHVDRPLGATIDLEYQRSGNTFEQPQNRWVMTQVTVFDGVAGDHLGNGADFQVTQCTYEGGQWDRFERQFYGYQKVTETQLNTTGLTATTLDSASAYKRITREYLNSNVYNKGLVAREFTADVQGGLDRTFLETLNTYLLRDIVTRNAVTPAALSTATVFPELTRTERRFYEGQPSFQKSTFTTHEYDTLGNVTRFVDAADVGVADDVEALISYTASDPACQVTYIVGRANAIDVIGNGTLMRKRDATINCASGNVQQVRRFLETGQQAVTDLTYLPNGNLQTVTGPLNKNNERYALTYVYDPVVDTHVTSITDSFGYTSTATYNLNYGKPELTTDINGQQTNYVYDSVGRVDTIAGPYELPLSQITIDFDYHPEAPVPFAFTAHIDKDAVGALTPTGTIDTIMFTDGLKRVLQTKKDASLHTTPAGTPQTAMIVSGRAIFDHVGRTIEQFYPVSEAKGTNTAFNTTFDSVQPTRMTYDILDRYTQSTIPDNTGATIAYGFGPDRSGATQFETLVTDANGVQKKSFHDVRELITAVQEFNPAGGQPILWTSYVYDPLKQITRVIDDKSNVTTVAYDNFGRRTAIDNPDLGKTETVYDLASNVTQKITANLRPAAQAIEYDYRFNRLQGIRYPSFVGNNVVYTYGAPGAPGNAANRLTQVTSEAGVEQRQYGLLGELIEQTWTIASDTLGASPTSPEVYTMLYQYDTWNRLLRMTYPDGEILTYTYDSGGLLNSAQGVKAGFTYDYIKRLEYDQFEQRTFVALGNNVRTQYTYDPLDRRLATLSSGKGAGNSFQNLLYTYDDVGNILSLANDVAVSPPSQFGGPTSQNFVYDDLYRLTGANGSYQFSPNKSHQYTLAMSYDSIHNIAAKQQAHTIVQPSGVPITQKKTSYIFNYAYGAKPHAPTHIGDRTYSYDANGNQLGWDHNLNGTRRTIVWDEENRIQSLFDNGHEKTYKYDDQGNRVIKRGPQGETVYVNRYFTIRNREGGTKHVFAGTTRMVSKLMKQDKPGANPKGKPPVEKDLYFFHPDHLGSTGYVTDTTGKLFEHLEYFPFGETWVEEVSNTQRTPYLFTGKELDEETGLYYFGARYYDPRTSVWQSADPFLAKYLPTGSKAQDKTLSGLGGVFNSPNLGLYTYTHQNPITLKDPDGNSTWINDNGNVVKVQNDSDLSIYQSLPNNQQGPPAKVGETRYWDSFVSPDTGKPVGRIYLNQNIDSYFYNLTVDARGMSAAEVAEESVPRGRFDIKNVFPGHEGDSYHGFLFEGKYTALREAGNILAGFNASSHGIGFEEFQKRAGALHQEGLWGLFKYEVFGTTYGSAPDWGEIPYQRTRSEFGYQLQSPRGPLD